MSVRRTCGCGKENYVVIHYKHNHSWFEAPKGARHPSQYSMIKCKKCGWVFSSKAKYVDNLPREEVD